MEAERCTTQHAVPRPARSDGIIRWLHCHQRSRCPARQTLACTANPALVGRTSLLGGAYLLRCPWGQHTQSQQTSRESRHHRPHVPGHRLVWPVVGLVVLAQQPPAAPCWCLGQATGIENRCFFRRKNLRARAATLAEHALVSIDTVNASQPSQTWREILDSRNRGSASASLQGQQKRSTEALAGLDAALSSKWLLCARPVRRSCASAGTAGLTAVVQVQPHVDVEGCCARGVWRGAVLCRACMTCRRQAS